jgi:hypothetical protein
LVITFAFPGMAEKVGVGLSRNLGEPEGKELVASTGPGRAPFPTEQL